MKKEYEEPILIIEHFPNDDDIIAASSIWGEDPEDPDDPIELNDM